MILSQTSHFSDFTVHLRLTECNEVLELTGDYVNRLSSQFLLVLQWTFVGAFFLVFRHWVNPCHFTGWYPLTRLGI